MTKFQLTLNVETYNAAFDESNAELASILRELAQRLETEPGIITDLVFASNGDAVGVFEFSPLHSIHKKSSV